MTKCPICRAELTEYDNEHMECSKCQELIPKTHALESKIPCCDPMNKCR